ncbi:MAG: trans-2,3-dihydro-3-hydroxyanthranilate isomerase, partial [Gammaproteobacteria bacterium]|nr:trans-2,3-dihydro-3-hydroxyanthranilate isomerase [Gammaproteobacteria bacterium]
LVQIRLLRDGGAVVGAEFTAPEALSIRSSISVEDAAACLSLAPADIGVATHAPQVISVGLPWLVTEVTTREGLQRAKPSLPAHERVLPSIGTDGVFVYYREAASMELHARVFAPLDATPEDPATGSAGAAIIALLAWLRPERDADLAWRIHQGVDFGRPSLLLGRTEKCAGIVVAVHVAGHAVRVMHGLLQSMG